MQDGGETQRAHRAGRSAETSLRRMLGRGPLGNAGWFSVCSCGGCPEPDAKHPLGRSGRSVCGSVLPKCGTGTRRGAHPVHDPWSERVHPMQGNLPRNPKESERRMVKQPQSSHWAGDKVWPHPRSEAEKRRMPPATESRGGILPERRRVSRRPARDRDYSPTTWMVFPSKVSSRVKSRSSHGLPVSASKTGIQPSASPRESR